MLTSKPYLFKELISEVISKFGDNNALAFAGEQGMTYSEMGQNIQGTIAFMENLGIQPEDKVILYSQNMPNWCITYLALQYMGAVAVPVLPDFNAHELENVINHCDPKAIFISESLYYKFDKLENQQIETIVRLDDFSLKTTSELVFDKNAQPKKDYSPDENALSVLLYTSGTTGNSKGVMLSQKNLITNVYQCTGVYEVKDTDRTLSVLPLSHTYENTVGFLYPISKGASISYLRKPPTSPVLQAAMKTVKPTFMLIVPMIIEKVYNKSILPQINKKALTRVLYKFRPTQILLSRIAGKKLYETFGGALQFFGIGGAKVDATVERFLRDAKFPISIGYGLTETAPLLAGSPPGIGKYQSTGRIVSNCEVIIHNPSPKTGEGEIWARGNNVMLGYYKNEEITKEVLTEDGWFKTGDLGSIDKDGMLTHRGRIKSTIVGANGENIYPEEIESLINKFDYVIESVVVEKDNRLVALVHFDVEDIENRIKQLKSITLKDVDDYVSELLPQLQHYINSKVNKSSKIQEVIHQEEPFIRTATKKIKRFLYIRD
jgi:long-chain acyl-CoA synthetase